MSARIDVHIDALVLDGFAVADRYAIAAGLERELTRLLGESAFHPTSVARIDAGEIALPPSGAGAELGVAVARRIAASVAR